MKIKILLSAFLLLVTGCLLAQEVNANESIVKVSKCVSGDCSNGYGRYEFSSGEYYEGEWKNGKRNGQGTNVYANGTKSTGQWKDDIFIAENTLVKVSKCVSGDCSNGYGRYEFSSGEYYEGEWKNGKRNGQGTNSYAFGNKYVGEWKDDKINGLGTLFYSDGTKKAGIWKDNNFIGESTAAESAVNNDALKPDKSQYFVYNEISGEYEIKDASGNVIKHSNLGGKYDQIEGLSAAYLEFEDDWGDSSFKKYGFIDSKNRVVIPFEYKEVENYYNGVSLVTIDGKYYDLIDKMGKQIHSFIADAAFSLGDNYIVVKQNNQFSLFDRAGKFLSISKYEEISNTNTDLIRVKYNNKYGYTDVNLNEVIPMIYQNAERFEDGFARVSTEYYKWGVINSAGKVVIPIKYQYIDSFHEGLAAVQFDELWGYMDITGKIVIPIKFFEAYNFHDGKAQVKSMDFVEYSINKKGEKVN